MSKIYDDLYDRVERMVRQFRLPEDDFQDIVQLVMMNIFDRRLDLQNIGSKLLYILVRNTIVDSCRRQTRREKYIDRNLYFDSVGTVCDSSAGGLPIYTPLEEEQCKERELDAAIECESLKPLSTPLHAVLELRLKGMIYKEIAEQLNISVGTVRSRLYHARRCNRANRH
ncbi:MAG: sigma-70 family RNA polymerase sigma factor [Candidatus Melainabacteria bacterium]|nr:sigma-70 family RNA polymerase sigma factor [Candidatus Melainabacteria bacterium]